MKIIQKTLKDTIKEFEEKLEMVRTGEKQLETFTELLNKANTLGYCIHTQFDLPWQEAQ